MALVAPQYRTDTGKLYSYLPVTVRQINNVATTLGILMLTPATVQLLYADSNASCSATGVRPRYILMHASNGALFQADCPIPFNSAIAEELTLNPLVAAFEFKGERISDYRLKFF